MLQGRTAEGYAFGDLCGFSSRRGVRRHSCDADRTSTHIAEEPFALDHLLADGAGTGAGADLHRGARRARAARAVAEIDHFVQHGIGEAFDLGYAVADFADGADILLQRSFFDAGDLGFNFL